jgi:protein-S-isoprenylcysteine O-methyltransferase Ste14
MKKLFIGFKSLIFALAFTFLWGWISLYISRVFDKYFEIKLPEWSQICGIILMMIGGVMALLCVVTFIIKGEGTPAPFDAPEKFVSSGPYKFVRNPMYVGGFTTLIGFGFYENSISILLFSIIWILFANIFIIYFEEPTLRKRFGITYDHYCRNVKRWIPNFKP